MSIMRWLDRLLGRQEPLVQMYRQMATLLYQAHREHAKRRTVARLLRERGHAAAAEEAEARAEEVREELGEMHAQLYGLRVRLTSEGHDVMDVDIPSEDDDTVTRQAQDAAVVAEAEAEVARLVGKS